MEAPETPTEPEAALQFRADSELVKKSLIHDAQAQRELLERLRCIPRMLAAKNARMGQVLSESEIEDLAQETVLSVWRKRGDYRGQASLETWIYPFCYHNLMNRIRKVRRRPPAVGLDAAQAIPAPEVRDYRFVYRALVDLGPPDEEIIRLKHFEALSFPEIGRVLGISPNTAKSRYYRGVERLRSIIASGEGGPAK